MYRPKIKIFNRKFFLKDLWRLRNSLLLVGLRLFRLSILLNLIKISFSKLFKRLHVWGFPYQIMIEPSSRCNLQCPMCGLTILGLQNRESKDMNFSEFKIVFDKLQSHLLIVAFWNFGEPLMNKDLFKMIAYSHEKKIFNVLTTNGVLLDATKAKEAIASALDYLVISIDGASVSTYERYRKGGDFNAVISNIRFLVSEKRGQASLRPFIELTFLIMKDNEKEINKMKELAKMLKVDKLTFKKASFDPVGPGNKFFDSSLFLPNNPLFIHQIHKDNYKREKYCRLPWEQMVINSDGSIIPCCQDFISLEKMGNIFTDSLSSIWNGEKFKNFRKKICSNIDDIELCKNCTQRNYDGERFLNSEDIKG